ncbi:MAG: hypothetical protein R3F65_30400 [bacterium]
MSKRDRKPSSHRLVIVSGPSCAGKSPLKDALDREFPELARRFDSPVLHHSRDPRPHEVDGEDYHFRTREQIEALRGDDRFLVFEVRDDLQAVDLEALDKLLGAGDVFYEGNPKIGLALREAVDAKVIDVFLSPLSLAEVRALHDTGTHFDRQVTELMRRRLLRRAATQHAILGLPELEDIETRAASAPDALREAHRFSAVIPCHDGEDSDHWSLLPVTLGDARRAVRALAAVIEGEDHPALERWPADLFAEVHRAA